jgi:transcriptional regulator with XRE-family HTH domain
MPAKKPLDPFVAALGVSIRRHREAAGFSQAELAARAKLDTQTVQRAEAGLIAVTVNTLAAIARGLDVSVGLVASGAGSPPEDEDDAVLLATWRLVPEERRRLVLDVLQAIVRSG